MALASSLIAEEEESLMRSGGGAVGRGGGLSGSSAPGFGGGKQQGSALVGGGSAPHQVVVDPIAERRKAKVRYQNLCECVMYVSLSLYRPEFLSIVSLINKLCRIPLFPPPEK